MRILVIHQYYLLPGESGGSRFNEFCRLWAEAGHEVSVVAGTFHHRLGATAEPYRGRWVTREQDGPVTVYRAHVPASYMKSYYHRMWSFFGFTLSSISALFRAKRPDVIIATSPPLITAITGWFAARVRWMRTPWVFEIRDLWPESAVTTGVLSKTSPLTKILYWLERRACRSANRINVLTPAFRTSLVERKLATGDKIVFVPNGADVEHFKPASRDNDARRRFNWGDRTVFMYAGAHGRANAVGQLIDAAELLRDRPDILIASVGYGPDREALEQTARDRKLDNIMFIGPQPKEAMPEIVAACDVGVAVLQRNPTFHTVYPNKVFDYMACARPTLLAIDGVARQLVCDDAKAGVFAEPEDAAAIAAQIRLLADDAGLRRRLGENGRQWVLANATRESLAARYLSVLESIARRTKAHPAEAVNE